MKKPKYFYKKQILQKQKFNKNLSTKFYKNYIQQVAQQLLREDIEAHKDCYRQTIKQ